MEMNDPSDQATAVTQDSAGSALPLKEVVQEQRRRNLQTPQVPQPLKMRHCVGPIAPWQWKRSSQQHEADEADDDGEVISASVKDIERRAMSTTSCSLRTAPHGLKSILESDNVAFAPWSPTTVETPIIQSELPITTRPPQAEGSKPLLGLVRCAKLIARRRRQREIDVLLVGAEGGKVIGELSDCPPLPALFGDQASSSHIRVPPPWPREFELN